MGKRLSPLDEAGQPVDWWFLYKVPTLTGATNATGYEYAYFDASHGHLRASPNKMNDGKGALDLTLASLFKAPSATTGWILYNDEMPPSVGRKDDKSLGHTKGVLAFDLETRSGFWLLHSWPKYADPRAAKTPVPTYGQTYLCIALDLATVSAIAAQMANHQEPQTYTPHLPPALAHTDPLFVLTQPLDPKAQGDSNVASHKSAGGLPFKVMAKNRKWGKDFWNDLVGPALGQDMDVDTWIRGPIPPILDSDGVHKVFDVKFIDLRPLGAPWCWPETHDHAKWGITYKDDWVCVGDINRMVSQESRGGGAVAFQQPALWAELRKTDLLVLPKGVTEGQAIAAIHATHAGARVPPPERLTGQRNVERRG